MIIWSGLGFLVAVFVFGSSLVANLITNSVTGGTGYWEAHKWPFGVSLIGAGILSWYVGRLLMSRKARVLVDQETGQEVVVEPNHALFFIKMYWWGPILCAIGIPVALSNTVWQPPSGPTVSDEAAVTERVPLNPVDSTLRR